MNHWGTSVLLLVFRLSTAHATDLVTLAKANGLHAHTGNESVFLFSFPREGQRRETILITALNSYELQVDNPNHLGCISLLAAMPFNLGDGAELKVTAADTKKAIYLDPAHVKTDRAWIPIHLDIPATAATVRVRFEVGLGPRHEGTADWVGVAGGNERNCLLSLP